MYQEAYNARHTRQRPLRLRRWIAPFCFLLVIGYFSYHATYGSRGLLTLVERKHTLAETKAQHAALKADRERLEHRVTLMRDGTLDPDLLDEQARKMLGYSQPDEVIIMFEPGDEAHREHSREDSR